MLRCPRVIAMGLSCALLTPGFQRVHAQPNPAESPQSGRVPLDQLSHNLEDVLDACEAQSEPGAACQDGLEAAIAPLITQAGPIARRRSILDALRRANLELVRATFAAGQREQAFARLRSIEAVRGLSLQERERFSPVLKSHAEDIARQVAEQRQVHLVVECGQPCTITLNHTPVEASVFLPPGSYQLGVVSQRDPSLDLVQTLDLQASVPELHIEFAKTKAAALSPSSNPKQTPTTPALTALQPPKPRVERPREPLIKPKRALQLGMALGVASTVTGSVLLSMDQNCPRHTGPGGYGPAPQGKCDVQLTETTVPGVITLGLGIATVITVATLMGVWRKRNRVQKATSWQRRMPRLRLSVSR